MHRVVERSNAGEPRSEGDVTHREGARFDENPCGLCPLGSCQGKRTGSNLRGELTLDLTDAVAEPARQTRHALTVNDTVADEAHRPRDQVRAYVPLRRARAGIRAATFTGPETRLLRGSRARVEAQVLQVGPSRAARAAVDAGGHNSADEPTVETCVPGPYGALAGFGVIVHVHQHASWRRLALAKIRHHRPSPRV